ncbi:MAG: malto-oligosyltrehalose synthase [Microthrixaceae bacterium]
MTAGPGSRTPSSTYRIQLRDGLTLDGVIEQGWLDHAHALGVSHLYLSPVLEATPGSSHGYDVVDPRRVDPSLGGDEALRRLAAAASQQGMGLLIDIVPNHMAADHTANPWWWDVLRNGELSEHAPVFDIDLRPPEQRLRGRIFLPVLGDHYGRVLDSGRIRLRRDGPAIVATVDDRPFPLSPESVGELLEPLASAMSDDLLLLIATSLRRVESVDITARSAELRVLDTLLALRLEGAEFARAVDDHLDALSSDIEAVHAVLESQHYRLGYWRAARDLGYRRFFDVSELIGVRMEWPHVFDATHTAIADWIDEGIVDGLRVDHPDGLADPAHYFERLRDLAPNHWIVVEKILESGEALPQNWPVDGTTGYEFAEMVARWLVDPSGMRRLGQLSELFVGPGPTGDELVHDMKRLVLTEMLAGDLDRVTDSLLRLCDSKRRFRDVTRHDLRDLLREFVVAMPVYRTYVAEGESARPEDVHLLRATLSSIEAGHPEFDAEVIGLLGSVLSGEMDATTPLAIEVRTRLQQLTGPAMAKGKEDTAFYRDVRLISRCEVGSDPSSGGIGSADLHEFLAAVQADHPATMTGLSTHDSKRGEDIRARLNVLSELPERWAAFLEGWVRASDSLDPDGRVDPRTRLLLAQTMVGAYPLTGERLATFALKAVREAKLTTSWLHPDEEYEASVTNFAHGLPADPVIDALVSDFVSSILDAGRSTSIAQKVLQLCAPGVPDLYWGTETWFFRLVDPDNRTAPDLKELSNVVESSGTALEPTGDLAKLHAVRSVLALRTRRPDAFAAAATYSPLEVSGADADRVFAFTRNDEMVCIVTRWPARGDIDPATTVQLPPGRWVNVLGGDSPTSSDAPLAAMLGGWSATVLERA